MKRSNAQGKESDRSCCLATQGSIAKYLGDDRGMKNNEEVYEMKWAEN